MNDNQRLILDYANTTTEPFTNADLFEAIDEIDDRNKISSALLELYNKGHLARRKTDGIRFQYILNHKDCLSEGFEATSSSGCSKKETEPKPTINQSNTDPIEALSESIGKFGKDVSSRLWFKPEPAKPKQKEPEQRPTKEQTIQISESFSLRLETRSGTTITITCN